MLAKAPSVLHIKSTRYISSSSTTSNSSAAAATAAAAAQTEAVLQSTAQPERQLPQKDTQQPVLSDLFGRFHNYLRISVTERCNLRCQYCMPEEGIDLTDGDKLMTTPEILRIARIFVTQGVDKIRLTGGEPTVRKDIVELIRGLNELRPLGLRKIAITTNGIALRRKLPALREAGLDGLNISLDTRDPRKFELFTRRKGGTHVLQAISEAAKLDFDFVKVNVVVMRGMNEDEVPAFVEMTHDEGIDVRFIEYMPFDGNKWGQKKLVGYRDMLLNLHAIYGDAIERLPLEKNHTAKSYRIRGYQGQFGFITSMTNSFCSACNRVRVMADGNLKVCLFGNTEVSLMELLRNGASDADITETIGGAIKRKHRAHAGLDILSQLPNRPMIKIGG
ncbi:Molybdenum cofactor synthesis protein 1 [Coemansia erecta]|uniref:GTP 3',8-cyclase n=1 Tax=Coemansia erecta TaxID=147472 RepID=A0A9W8CT11_9FUNG|nr:Molybdenum cofactor synthesis protein 1 [Coemansia erecta]